MKTIILTLWFLICVAKGFSMEPNSASLNGKVYDKNTKAPVEYASVAVYTSDSVLVIGTVTDSKGNFTLKGLKPGNYYIEISFIGYKTKRINVNPEKPINMGEVLLEQDNQILSDAEVAAEKSIIQYQIDKQVINPSNMLTASNGTAIDVLRQSPSVTVDSEENVIVRGSGDYMLLVDGKPVTANKTDILRQISAAQISKVEVITNPSAKYDAAGSSGIIHIYTIKSNDDFSGLINARCANGNKNNVDGIVRKKAGNFSFQLAGNYSSNRMKSEGNNEFTAILQDTMNFLTADVKRNMLRNNYSIRPEVDYRFNDKTKLSLNAGYTRFEFDRNIDVFYSNKFDTTWNYYASKDDLFIGADQYISGLFFQHNFDSAGHNIEVTAFYMNWKGINDQSTIQNYADLNGNTGDTELERNYYEDHIMNESRLSVDYQKPLASGIQTESGLRTSIRRFWCDKEFRNLDVDQNNWSVEPLYTGIHTFHEEMQSLYYSASKEINSFSIKAGVRSQYYTRYTNIPEQSTEIDFRKLYWFPSIHVNYSKDKIKQWQLSYSRRIQLPDDWSTSPVPFYNDGFIVQTGNPALQPEMYDVAELNHIRYIKETMLSLSVFSRITHNAVERLLYTNSDNQFVLMPKNVADKYFTGVEARTQIKIFPWFTASVNANSYVLNSRVNTLDTTFYYNHLSYNFRSSLQFKFAENIRFEISAAYFGPEKEMSGVRESMYWVDMSLRQTFLNKKLSLTLTFNNSFNTNEFRVNTSYDNYSSKINSRQEYPVVFMGLSYTINDYRPSQQRQQETQLRAPGV